MIPPLLWVAIGAVGGIALAEAWHDAPDAPPQASSLSRQQLAMIREAEHTFLPGAEAMIADAQEGLSGMASALMVEGGEFVLQQRGDGMDTIPVPRWKEIMARTPGLTEAVAMYWAMLDPDTPMLAKATIAGALLYLVSPADLIPDNIPVIGQLDDIVVVLNAARSVYEHIKPEHLAAAREWLVERGVQPKPIFELGDLTELFTVQEGEGPRSGCACPCPCSSHAPRGTPALPQGM